MQRAGGQVIAVAHKEAPRSRVHVAVQGGLPGLTGASIWPSKRRGQVFDYDLGTVALLKELLTADRLTSYLAFAKPPNDDRAAIDLYDWNTALCAAFYTPIQALEIALRNALHREMSSIFERADWYSDWAFKVTAASLVCSLAEAANRLTKTNKLVDPPHMIAALHFGFWTQLTRSGPDGNYKRLFWNAGLYNAFPHYPGDGKDADGKISRELLILKDFRNRVAHHEPIHNKKPERYYERILKVAAWVDPMLPKWIQHHSECPKLFQARPGNEP